MKLSIYKEDLLKNDIPNFINTLEKMKNDNNTYSEIKRLNNFLKDFIESISDKIIEKDNYRIIPYDYSLTYLFSLYLQSKVDFAEYMVQVMKNDRCYSSFKAARKSYDCTIEDNFAYEHPLLQGIALKRLYYDLFAYKMLKDTEIVDKDKLVQDLKDRPDSLQRLDEYAKYFDILLSK